MPPRHARLSRRLLAAAAVASAAAPLALVVPVSADAVPWGTVLVPGPQWAGSSAALGDLNVYSNGNGSQDQVTAYGLSYECVELAQRFAAVRFGEQPVWPVAYAYQMWAAGPNLKLPLIQEPNGGGVAPQAGDIMVFDRSSTSSTGHVAVVADTVPGYVDIVEQNWDNTNPTGTARLSISGTTIGPRSGMPVLGWLRSPTAAIPRLPVLVTSGGGAWSYDNAHTYGSLASTPPAFPVVGGASTASGHGYWMDASDGGVFAFGDAAFHGSMGGHPLNKPVVGMASTPDGNGYWLVASDGGIFAFGDAGFYGSMGGKALNKPVVGMAATPDGKGYWLVASDGGIFAFGDATFQGSMGGKPLNKPVDAMAATADGNGYWMVASDGGIFAFGDAGFYGSAGGSPPKASVAAMTPTTDGLGYWLTAANGTVLAYGDAVYIAGSGTGAIGPTPVVGVVTTL